MSTGCSPEFEAAARIAIVKGYQRDLYDVARRICSEPVVKLTLAEKEGIITALDHCHKVLDVAQYRH